MIRSYTTVLPPLTGGVNYAANRMAIAPNEGFRIVNCHIDAWGRAYTRKGSELLNTTALQGKVTSIHEYVVPTAGTQNRTILVSAGKRWYSWDSSNGFTLLYDLQSDAKPSVVNFLDGNHNTIAILANGTDFLKYDGSSVSNLLSASSDFPNNEVPRYLTVYDNRLGASGCSVYPRRVYMSGLLDPTSWDADNDYFQYEDDAEMERITGITSMYKFLVVTKRNRVYINTEGNPQSTTFEQIPVSTEYGSTSHWSLVVVGNRLYMCNESGFYIGTLRQQIENGLDVQPIHGNLGLWMQDIKTFVDVQSVYDANTDEIYTGVETGNYGKNNRAMIYNVGLSNPDEQRFIWSGWFEGDGYEPLCFGKVTNSDGKVEIWRGDSNGYVYRMENPRIWKDQLRSGGETTNQNIATRIHLGPFSPGGISKVKRFLDAIPQLYQHHNGSTILQFLMNQSYVDSTTGVSVELDGHVPLWNDESDSDYTQGWDDTVWVTHPVLPVKVNIRKTGRFVEFIIYNAGSNDYDEIAYGGMEIIYQYIGRSR